MPSQEDRVIRRIQSLLAFVRDNPHTNQEKIEAWAYSTQGIRPRTVGGYIGSLLLMGNLKYNTAKKTFEVAQLDSETI
jgi:hypothetical protein